MDESGRGLSKDNEIRREISHPTGMNRESSMILENCRLCARLCGVNRMKNRAGRCGQTEELVVARAALHMWEEPCISGREGSGTVFFVGCPLGCVFCQNRDIAAGSVKSDAGKKISISRLADIFNELQEAKANNINLVTPTHYVPQIVEAVRLARAEGLHIPIVYNTGSVETPETVHLLEGTVDIFLPDLKFCGQDIAYRYAHMADYFDAAAKAIREMAEIAGEAAFDTRGMMTRGVIVRHMVLPGHTKDSKAILKYLWETYGDRIYVSIMNQYTPMPGIEREFPELGRRVTRREYDRVVDYALELGFTNAFVQEGPTAEESFIPAFDATGV